MSRSRRLGAVLLAVLVARLYGRVVSHDVLSRLAAVNLFVSSRTAGVVEVFYQQPPGCRCWSGC